MNIQPINRTEKNETDSLYMHIVERIRQCILRGELKDGDLLPSERELAQMFDVSRVPVREALKVLEFLGAVKHVRGKGVFVQKVGIGKVLDNIGFLMTDPTHLLNDLYEARQGLECRAVKLAAERRTEEDLFAIESELLEMEKLMTLGANVAEASVRFHSAFIAASKNALMMHINELLVDLLRFSRSRSLQKQSRYEEVLQDHRQIFEKIRQQDVEGAAKALYDHLEKAKKVVLIAEQNQK